MSFIEVVFRPFGNKKESLDKLKSQEMNNYAFMLILNILMIYKKVINPLNALI